MREVCRRLPPGAVEDLPTGDTVVCRDSFDAALAAAGNALAAAREATPAMPTLAVCRPPGHHAEPSRGMGFCLINNVAVAGAWARRERGPILIADCDYHHGNGTQAWVERQLEAGTDGIGFISTHAYPAYPGTGAFGESHVEAGGFILDIPLTHQTDGETFVGVWQTLLSAAVRRLRPAVILVSAGFDFLAGDPIAGLPVGPPALPALFSLFAATAQEGKAALVFVLEGGYSLANMRAAGAALAKAFCVPTQPPPPPLLRQDQVRRMTEEAARWLARPA